MGKFKLDSPNGTPLDPFAFEKQFVKPVVDKSNDFTGVEDQLEFVTPVKIDPGYGTLGNASLAQEIINETKAYDQSSLELVAKGIGNVVKTIGIEAAKTPGYFAGVVGAIGNEVLGDGKNSMSMIVDNGWVNAFESLDEAAKEAMPVYLSKQVMEGGLLDKMGSGAWWASTGADGLGFMLSMFLPGAVAKAAKVGSGIASVGEGLANISPMLGKLATKAGLVEKVGESLKYTTNFARNADGYASAILNTTLEASAEAANTFDTVKNKYISQGLSEEEAKAKAGEAASAVFKGNVALLAFSNILDEMWIWKTIGSAGEKEAAQSILSKVIKNGEVDLDALKKVAKEFTTKDALTRSAKNFGKGVIKEGAFEEGSQTTLQQNIESGNISQDVLDNLSNVATSYFDDFANNKELHESIFLGGLLGGGASVIGTVRENMALKAALGGSGARTKDNSVWAKLGFLPETKAQKGLINLVADNHINHFRSYKDVLTKDEFGDDTIDEQKLIQANFDSIDNIRTNILYDLAVSQGDKTGQEIYGQYIAANYAQSFLGQEGGKEVFEQHVKDHVVPAWSKRFEETFNREATAKEVSEYETSFKKSGERIFNSHKVAEQTNYPERYYHEKSKVYQDFRNEYFHNKFQTLITLDSIKERKSQIQNELSQVGLFESDLEDLSQIKDQVKKQAALLIKQDLAKLNELDSELNEFYPKFFTKAGVKEMFESFKNGKELFDKHAKELLVENEELKKNVDLLPEKNNKEINRILDEAGFDGSPINVVDKKGKKHFIARNPENGKFEIGNKDGVQEVDKYKGDLTDLKLTHDDVSQKTFDEFKTTGKVPESTKKRIQQKIASGEPLSEKESQIAQSLAEEAPITSVEVQEPIDEDNSPEKIDEAVDSTYRKKGVYLYPSTGRNLLNLRPQDAYEQLTSSPSQKLWFEVLDSEVVDNPTAYTAQVVRKDDKSNLELYNQIDRDIDPGNTNPGDLYVVLYKDGKPVIKEGNYVFTGLWRPDNLYPVVNGKPQKFILAESTILDNFKLYTQLPSLKVSEISKSDADKLKQFGVDKVTEDNIMAAAFFHAKKEYTEWYKNLQDNPGQLQVAGVTKGHTVKEYVNKDGKKELKWFKPLNGIPGLSLVDSKSSSSTDLKGGRFELSISGVINVAGEEYSVSKGDVVIVDTQDNVHPLRSRNINDDEVKTIMYLLSLRSGTDQATETIKVSPPGGIKFGNTVSKTVPVFFNSAKKKSRQNLMETLISFGNKNGGKGEIYFNKESIVVNDPLLVWTDFKGQSHNIKVSKIKDAVDKNDFSEVQDLFVFLQNKKFSVNEHLLGTTGTNGNPIFNKPKLVYKVDERGIKSAELDWDNSKSYYDHLLNDVLTTTTQHIPGYPKRVQRNMWFNKQAIQEKLNVVETTGLQNLSEMATGAGKGIMKADVETNGRFEIDISKATLDQQKQLLSDMQDLASTNKYIYSRQGNIASLVKTAKNVDVLAKIKAKKASLDSFKDMDKILTTSDLLKLKIKNGEIKQNCK